MFFFRKLVKYIFFLQFSKIQSSKTTLKCNCKIKDFNIYVRIVIYNERIYFLNTFTTYLIKYAYIPLNYKHYLFHLKLRYYYISFQ